MKLEILHAKMSHTPEEGYVGHVQFTVSGHEHPYEITLFSKRGHDWMYGLHFQSTSGKDEQIEQVEEWLEEDDEAFESLVAAAKQAQASV